MAIKGTGAVLDAEGEAGVRAAVAVFGRGEHQFAQIRCRNHLASSNGNAVQAQAACTGQAVNAHALQALAGIGILKLEVRCVERIGGVFEGGAGLVGAVRRGVATHGDDDGGGVAGAVRVGQGVGDLYRAGHVRRRGEHQFAVGINDDAALTRVFQFRFANGQLAVVVVSVFVVGLHVDGHRGVDGGAGGVVVRLRGMQRYRYIVHRCTATTFGIGNGYIDRRQITAIINIFSSFISQYNITRLRINGVIAVWITTWCNTVSDFVTIRIPTFTGRNQVSWLGFTSLRFGNHDYFDRRIMIFFR